MGRTSQIRRAPGRLPGTSRRQPAAPAVLHQRQAQHGASPRPPPRLPHRRKPAGHPAHHVPTPVTMTRRPDQPRSGPGTAPPASILPRRPLLPAL